MLALQKQHIKLAKRQSGMDIEAGEQFPVVEASALNIDDGEPTSTIVSMPLTAKGHAFVARHLLIEATCTYEYTDASGSSGSFHATPFRDLNRHSIYPSPCKRNS